MRFVLFAMNIRDRDEKKLPELFLDMVLFTSISRMSVVEGTCWRKVLAHIRPEAAPCRIRYGYIWIQQPFLKKTNASQAETVKRDKPALCVNES